MTTIITCAVTGAVTRPDQTPYLPVTPEQIATSSLEAAEAGASVIHIHVRDPKTGRPSMETELYRDVVDRIKQNRKDILINLTTGPGSAFINSAEELEKLCQGQGRAWIANAQDRVRHIELIQPELCSLDFNTMQRGAGGQTQINHPDIVKEMLRLIQQAGTKPELEIFDTGDMVIALEMYNQGLIKGQPFWQFATGIKYGWPASHTTLTHAQAMMPANSVWSAFGIGKEQMPMVAQTMLRGGHVRVGMEDNIYLSKGELVISNAELVSRARDLIKMLGGTLASTAQAREILLK
jgi:uncharacterized protein (DUF849 family)